jgi:hypothetical protein
MVFKTVVVGSNPASLELEINYPLLCSVITLHTIIAFYPREVLYTIDYAQRRIRRLTFRLAFQWLIGILRIRRLEKKESDRNVIEEG